MPKENECGARATADTPLDLAGWRVKDGCRISGFRCNEKCGPVVKKDTENRSTFATAVDELTVKRAQQGDMQAMAVIYDTLAKPCFNLAYRMAGSAPAAEDIVHETFVKVISKIKRFRGKSPLWAWVRQITFNTAINHLNRAKWVQPLQDGATLEQTLADPHTEQQPAVQYDAEQLLAQLAPRSRAVLLMHDLEGMTHGEIAAAFGQTESFSKSVLFRARKQLQTLIERQSEPTEKPPARPGSEKP